MGIFFNIPVRATWLGPVLGLLICLGGASARGATPATVVQKIEVLDASVTDPTVAEITSGALDSHFTPSTDPESAARSNTFWLKLQAVVPRELIAIPVLSVHQGHFTKVAVYEARSGVSDPLPRAARVLGFAGIQDIAFILPPGSSGAVSVYVRVEPTGRGSDGPRFNISTLDAVLDEGAVRARMIALCFGAAASMAFAALLIWLVLSEKAFLLYALFFSLQALYVAYFSGQAFEWPLLSYAAPLTHYMWNVPLALSGAAACLFTREIADLERFSPRVYAAYGWLAAAFVVLTFSNLAKLVGLSTLVNAFGNILFLGGAVFTLVVAFMAWRRGSRPAGWFLLAWGVLEAFTIATAVRLLLNGSDAGDQLLYFGLPPAMVAAALLIALALADRLREQRVALTEAQRRAQIDSLTGVLNRRSLIERLDAACLRAQARGLPISLLFIDLDHFKEINDSFGHPAGDACLAGIIPPIQAELRQSDVIGRYGGEEFVVILSSADAAAAHPIAQRILERVAGVRIEGFGQPITLTCSIGVATSDTLGVWGEHLIARADAAVYAAKRSGRNRVKFAVPMAA